MHGNHNASAFETYSNFRSTTILPWATASTHFGCSYHKMYEIDRLCLFWASSMLRLLPKLWHSQWTNPIRMTIVLRLSQFSMSPSFVWRMIPLGTNMQSYTLLQADWSTYSRLISNNTISWKAFSIQKWLFYQQENECGEFYFDKLQSEAKREIFFWVYSMWYTWIGFFHSFLERHYVSYFVHWKILAISSDGLHDFGTVHILS